MSAIKTAKHDATAADADNCDSLSRAHSECTSKVRLIFSTMFPLQPQLRRIEQIESELNSAPKLIHRLPF